MRIQDDRYRMLDAWSRYIADAAHKGALTGRPCGIQRIVQVAGPRAGALELRVGLEAGALLRAFSKNAAALARQFIPWDFAGDPQCFMSGRYVRIEAGWPSDMAERMIRLGDLCEKPEGGGRWVAGKSETGATIVPSLSDRTPHFLVSGATGSGKSVALQSAVLQLSQDPDNAIVLVDGKAGESLRKVERLPGIVGPTATEGPDVRAALGWAAAEMRQRYEAGWQDGRLILIIDEFQELISDQAVVDLLRKLVAQGRAAHVHCLLATQHPTVAAFGDSSIRRNLVGKVALRVGDSDASRIALGSATPRADYLLGAGDCYAVGPGACHRVQLAYVDEREITAGENGNDWRFHRWPDYEAESVGQDLPNSQFIFTGEELGVALVSTAEAEGRPLFTNRMEAAGFGRPGYNRQKRLRDLAQGALDWMGAEGYTVGRIPATANVGQVVPIPSVW